MMPRVTLRPPSSASAFPIAMTSSPTWVSSELPSFANASPVASTLSTARSLSPEVPSTFAVLLVPSVKVTSMLPFAPWTTWLLVTTTPSAEITKPVPSPLPVRIATTAGSTFARIPWMSCASAITEVLRPVAAVLGRTTTVRVVVSLLSRAETPAATPPPTSAPTSAPATNCFHAPGRLGALAPGGGDCGGGAAPVASGRGAPAGQGGGPIGSTGAVTGSAPLGTSLVGTSFVGGSSTRIAAGGGSGIDGVVTGS